MRALIVALLALMGVAHAETKTVAGEKFGAYCGRFDPKHPLTITFRLRREVIVSGIVIVGRNTKSLDAARAHGRVAAISIITDGDNKQRRDISDPITRPTESLIPGRPFSDDGPDSPELRLIERDAMSLIQVTTKRVTVVIDRIIPGTRYQDVCVGSIELTHPTKR